MEIRSNKLVLIGTFDNTVDFSHEFFGERFLRVFVNVKRLSGYVDSLPVIVSERLVDLNDYIGKKVKITGRFVSYSKKFKDGKKHLLLNVFAETIELADEELEDHNTIFLDGYILRPVKYRVTPLGRKISDILLKVNRRYGKTDYIPCIAWGRNAIYAAKLPVGTHLTIEGRIQSKIYYKNEQPREAYEISISRIEENL